MYATSMNVIIPKYRKHEHEIKKLESYDKLSWKFQAGVFLCDCCATSGINTLHAGHTKKDTCTVSFWQMGG